MSQSLVKIVVHVVFSTKNRVDMIAPEVEDGLYGYIHGIVENNKSKLIAAGGTANHIHLLISLGKIDISVLVGDIKRASSVWMKQHNVKFYWQEGYGAFSVGGPQVQRVIRYIGNQKRRHARQEFQDELRMLLHRYQVEYDERYVWD